MNGFGSSGEYALGYFPQTNWQNHTNGRKFPAVPTVPTWPEQKRSELLAFSSANGALEQDVFTSQSLQPSFPLAQSRFSGREAEPLSPISLPPQPEPAETKGKNRLGFFFGFLQAGVAMTMAPVFLVSTLMGARSKAMHEAGLAAQAVGQLAKKSGHQWTNPAQWFKQVLKRATEATIVHEKSHGFVRKAVNGASRPFLKRDLADRDIKKMYELSKIMLTATVFPKALNGIVYGVNAQQPSMIFEHAIELLLFPFALAQTPFIQNALFMLSGLFSLGLANDLDNDKKRAAQAQDLRVYDMAHLKDILKPSSHLGLSERFTGVFKEGWGMTRFVGEDMKVGLQRVNRDLTRMAHQEPNEILNAEGNGGKASLNFALLQLGTAPKLMLSFMKNENGPVGQAIRAYSSVMQSLAVLVGDISIFMLGKDGQTLGEKIPMAGVTTEAAGRIISYGKAEQPVATFLQKLGEAGNSIFYAVRAAKLEK